MTTEANEPACPNDGSPMTKSADGTQWVCPQCGATKPVKK